MQTERSQFYTPDEILTEVEKKIENAKVRDEPIDYLTFVPDGEPTLDIDLGKHIELLKPLGIKIAAISNSSLIWKDDVREDLSKADRVSLKIDSITQDIWRKINRPHRSLKLDKILEGISEFSNTFKGELNTETMLVRDINDVKTELEKIADFIGKLNPKKSYISIPTRPPAEKWVKAAAEERINTAYQIFTERPIDVEYLIGYEGNEFAFTGDVEDDLLSITSVHPMREDAVNEFLAKAKADWNVIETLIDQDKLIDVKYNDKKFYMRKFSGSNRNFGTSRS